MNLTPKQLQESFIDYCKQHDIKSALIFVYREEIAGGQLFAIGVNNPVMADAVNLIVQEGAKNYQHIIPTESFNNQTKH